MSGRQNRADRPAPEANPVVTAEGYTPMSTDEQGNVRVQGVVAENPPQNGPAGPAAGEKPKKAGGTGNPELKAMARITKYLDTLPPKARKRVANYLASYAEGEE